MCSLLALLMGIFTMVELNCENLFDCRHDSLKEDTEYLPTSYRHWTPYRYWTKLNHIGQEIIACGEYRGRFEIPDLVALTRSKTTVCFLTSPVAPYCVRLVTNM